MRVTFIHLDLGLGGAERLIVDAACALKLRGHSVTIATSHHDPNRCFEETKPSANGILSRDVLTAGDWIPRHCGGRRFHLLFAVLRMLYVSFWCANRNQPQLLIVDQVSFIVPFLWLVAPGVPVLFYCHFPDKLLAPKSKTLFRRWYRNAFDKAEEWTTMVADRIVVNSEFTSSVVRQVFPTVAKHHALTVLYPCVDVQALDEEKESVSIEFCFNNNQRLREIVKSETFVLSINRFERKKGLDLAIKAFNLVVNETSAFLVLAGGYDTRVQENIDHLQELKALVSTCGLNDRVFFAPSCDHNEKRHLLNRCRFLVYTPIREHFGIVPIEAGAARVPVIACNSGGPMESVEHGITGLLVEPKPEAFAEAFQVFLNGQKGKENAAQFGCAARLRVEQMFSRQAFGESLEKICEELYKESLSRSKTVRFGGSALWIVSLIFGVLALVVGGYLMTAQKMENENLETND